VQLWPDQKELSDAIALKTTSSRRLFCRATTFEGAFHRRLRTNYLASPPPSLVAYALAGDMNVDLAKDGQDQNAVYALKISGQRRKSR
jgi:aconitate hydratase